MEFPVSVKEIAQVADPVTQTFRVRGGMKAQPGAVVLPGMSATVILTYRRARSYMNLLNTEATFAQLELAVSNGVSLSTRLDDEVFDPIRSTARFKAILAQNDTLRHRCTDAPHRTALEPGAGQDLRSQNELFSGSK